jgi:hypothetical protein
MTDPISAAIVGSLTSQVAKGAAEWLKNRGPEISEDEWMVVGYQIGNELLAIKAQFEQSPTVLNELEREVRSAWQTYEQLAQVGEDFELDETFVKHYREMSESCSEWSRALELNDKEQLYGNQFTESFDEYKSDALPLMQ